MPMTDGLQYAQSVVIGLIVSFLLAKLFSTVFSSGDENLGLIDTNPNEHESEVVPSVTRWKSAEKDGRSDAEFSKKRVGGGDKELLIDQKGKIGDSDDDWEGVETTALDDAFCAATAFVAEIAADRSSLKVSSDLRLKLYGLYKVATEGACSVPQPSAIKITARAKWNAWHKLGSMSPEEAMQKYLEIITELCPNWADGPTFKRRGGDNNETSSEDTRPMGPDFSSSMHEEELGNEYELDAIHDFAREGDADNLVKHSEGQTPLHGAIDHDHFDVAEMLSSRNADINQKDNESPAPLHDAAVCEPDETDVLLVKKNAATGIQDDDDDDDGNHPTDLSHSNWHSI